ncbi:hypothetical protein ACFQ1E_07735 [Sphingomonas canadensis]|uniref:Uncharacterized protein n=1 Tax=Sphingomonas canadensis TaxID=1219257 RepID=A0ABW3H989_9SPHN|nr:hypothetical protein [Sphingomonas canadensis]MCW3835926.1 hypothetical protein [Sphingomonas canadensis]
MDSQKLLGLWPYVLVAAVLAGVVFAVRMRVEARRSAQRVERAEERRRNIAYDKLWRMVMLRPRLQRLTDQRPRDE